MGAAASARLLAVGAAFRLTGAAGAGRALTRAAAGDREDERTLAGMLLVRAGDRSVPVLAATLRSDPAAVGLVEVLASIGSDAARRALTRVAADAAPAVATAATEALRTLDRTAGPEEH